MGTLNLSPGDHALVINGRQSSAFDAQVTEIGGGTITVFVPDKDAHQTYNLDGSAVWSGSPAILVPEDHRLGRFLNARRKHRLFHEQVMRAAKKFRDQSTDAHAEELRRAVVVWTTFVSRISEHDHAALHAMTLEEYLQFSDS